ncbi:MAG: hypothetical protein HC808_10615 [Candidatus Competibacteraceae bacterium]|nr:hypothetical protein [Candidatus Competibacteraceae bacterium]
MADIAGFQATADKLLADQIAMQEIGMTYSSESTNEKTKFDTVMSGIERQGAIGESISKLSNTQSQQITQ